MAGKFVVDDDAFIRYDCTSSLGVDNCLALIHVNQNGFQAFKLQCCE